MSASSTTSSPTKVSVLSPPELPPQTPLVQVSNACKKYSSVLGALLFYFTASIALTMFNKWFFAEDKTSHVNTAAPSTSMDPTDTFAPATVPATTAPNKGKFFNPSYQFHFPLTVTCVHQFLVWVLILLLEKRVLKPLAGDIVRNRQYVYTICPIGFLCGIDWGLSNTSLRYIPLSLYEIVKSASPVFVLCISFALGMVQPSKQLCAIVGAISVGMFLAVSGGDLSTFSAEDFPMRGFICVCCAAVLAGIRVVLAQRVMQRSTRKGTPAPPPSNNDDGDTIQLRVEVTSTGDDEGEELRPLQNSGSGTVAARRRESGTNSPAFGNSSTTSSASNELPPANAVTTLFYAAPASAVSLIIPAVVVESRDVMEYFNTESDGMIYGAIFWILVSSSVAFLLSISEFVVTRKTSALTLCVTGMLKQVLVIGLAMMIFGDRMQPMNIFGFCITLTGIFAYNLYKLKQAQMNSQSPGSPVVQNPTCVNNSSCNGSMCDVKPSNETPSGRKRTHASGFPTAA